MGYELDDVEKPFVEQLVKLGWTHVQGCSNDPAATGRSSFKEVIQEKTLREKLRALNLRDGRPWLDDERIAEAISALTRLGTSDLIDANQKATELLGQGYTVNGLADWNGGRNQTIQYIDWDTPANNQFTVINQYRVDCPPGHDAAKKYITPDIVLLVNGIPLVVVECKSPTVADGLPLAVDQLRSYSNQRKADGEVEENEGCVPLFYYNQALVVTTFDKAKVGTITAEFDHYAPWKTLVNHQGQDEQNNLLALLDKPGLSEQERLVGGMLSPVNLLDMVRTFVLFMQTGGKTIKVLCRYQQYRAVNLALLRMKTNPTRKQHGEFDRRGGIIWHTQGSGKSLTMVFLVRKMRHDIDLRKFKVVMITDRKDLQAQLAITANLTGEVVEIGNSAASVKKLVQTKGPALIFATIQKHRNPDAPKLKAMRKKEDIARHYPVLNEDESILVLVDEAHRSHAKDLHAMLMAGLPNCVKIAFTGTPIIMGKKKHTQEIFDEFIDRYTIKESEEDGATVPILYEGRTAKGGVKDGATLDEKFADLFNETSKEKLEAIKKKYATKGHILDAPLLIAEKARDMLRHYVLNILPNGFKAQIVAHSRLAAIRYYDALLTARDELLQEAEQLTEAEKNMSAEEAMERCSKDKQAVIWAWRQRDYVQSLEFAPIISGTNSDGASYKPWTDGTRQEVLIKRFKKPLGLQPSEQADPLAFLVVKSMLLAGFDAPIEAAMYLDRPIKEAELLQAIARVNRTGFNKRCGIVIDYFGVAHHLQQALSVYAKKDIEGALRSIKDELPNLRLRHRQVCGIFQQRDLDFYGDVESCVQALANDKLRAQFSVALKQFLVVLDTILPRPEALAYTIDAKQLAYIYARARNRYRDTVELGKDVGHKVRALIDEHVISLGIDPKIQPLELTDPKFAKYAASQGSDRAKASEMEHAIRSHIRKRAQEDPERYAALSKKLEQVLKSCGQHWDDLLKKLQELIDEMTGKDAKRDPLTEGLPDYCAPFMRLVAAAHAEPGKPLTEEKVQVLQTLTGEVVAMMATEIQENRDLWAPRKAADQEALNTKVFTHLVNVDMDLKKAGILADKLMETAKANTNKLMVI